MPVPEETERQFGKGKTQTEESAVEETERTFAVKMNKENGRITLNKELLRGN